jgi:hypothetical protein
MGAYIFATFFTENLGLTFRWIHCVGNSPLCKSRTRGNRKNNATTLKYTNRRNIITTTYSSLEIKMRERTSTLTKEQVDRISLHLFLYFVVRILSKLETTARRRLLQHKGCKWLTFHLNTTNVGLFLKSLLPLHVSPSTLQLLTAMILRVSKFVDPNRRPMCLCNFLATCSRKKPYGFPNSGVDDRQPVYTYAEYWYLCSWVFPNFLLFLRTSQGLAWRKREKVCIMWYGGICA